jgi:hypothetical protein
MESTKVFIIHSKMLEIRVQHIEKLTKLFSSANVTFEFIEKYDPSTIVATDVQQKINLNKQNNGELYDELIRNMHINQISNGLKHGDALQKAKEEQDKYKTFLFIEDDVLFGDDIIDKMKEAITLLNNSSDIDILFLGLPSLSPIEDKNTLKVCPTSEFYRLFPCCDSYMIKSSNISKIADMFFPIKYITNFHLSYIVSQNNLQSSMIIPNIFLDGSKYGAYLSSVDPNNRMMFNPEFIQLTNMLQNNSSDDKTKEIAFENMKFKNHPDVMHLNAIYFMTKGEFKKAATILENILQVSTQNGCIINSDTEFLKTYMRLYKFIQD